MSGYEKSPDYGGPELHWRDVAIAVVVMVAVTAVLTLGLTGTLKRLISP